MGCLSSKPEEPGAVVVMITWYLELQLPMQSKPINTKVVSLNPAHVLNTILCDKACQ